MFSLLLVGKFTTRRKKLQVQASGPEPKMVSTRTHDMQELKHSGEFFNARTKVDGRLPPKSADDRQPADSKYDLRRSMAWDSAFFTSQGVLDSEELFQTLNFLDSENGFRKYERNAQKLPSESVANVRRSLAWDSAFFTSQGVLDPEELCLVNKGFRKFEANSLPCAREELWRSTESSTTIDSEYSLDGLEFELFDGMKASLLKSSNTAKDGHSGSRMPKGVGIRKLRSSRKSHAPVKKMNKSFPGSGRQIDPRLGEERTRKEVSFPTGSLHVSQSGRTNPASSTKISTMPDGSKTLAVATGKKVFPSENNAKPGNRIRKAASGQNVAKKPCLGEVCREPQDSLKSPRSASHCRSSLKESAGCYSASSSISKSPQITLRRMRHMGLAACDPNSTRPPKSSTSRSSEQITSRQPIPKSSSISPLRETPLQPLLNSPTPSKSSSRSRNESLSSSQPTHVFPAPKSLCSSPYMSTNEVKSSSSLDSTVFLKEGSVGCDAHETSDIGDHNCSSNCSQNGEYEVILQSQQVDLISKGSSPLVSDLITETKPSCLRKPSPTLGYFDVEISTPPSPNREVKFHAGAHNISKTSDVNGLTGSKLPSPRPSSRKGNMKMTSPQTGLSGKLNHGQEADRMMKNRKKFKSTEEFLQNVKKPCLGQNEDGAPHDDDKENLCSIGNQVDELSRSLGAIDFSRDYVIEF